MSATGTSGPAFSQVIHAEIARYGFAGATVLALIRFRCLTPGKDRVMVDGVRHWKVSYADMGKILGVSKEQVRGAIARCGSAITANEAPPVDDRKKAFHVPPYGEALTCSWDSDHTDDMQVGFSPHPEPDPVVDSTHPVVDPTHPVVDPTHPVVDFPHVPLSEELEEKEQEGGERQPDPLDAEVVPDPANTPSLQTQSENRIEPASTGEVFDGEVLTEPESDPDPEPGLFCREHMPDGPGRSCGPCGDARRVHDRWERRQPPPPPKSKMRDWWKLTEELRAAEEQQSPGTGRAPSSKARTVAGWAAEARAREQEPAPPAIEAKAAPAPTPRPVQPESVRGPNDEPRCRRHAHLPHRPPSCQACARLVADAAGESP